MLETTGSAEIAEWIAELGMRAKEEREAMDKAKNESAPVFGG